MKKDLKEIERELKKLKKVKITFLEPERLHPKSDDKTIADVATFLEQKYKLCNSFIKYIKPKLMEKASSYILNQTNHKWTFLLERFLIDEWRDYIVSEKHGIKTKASRDRGDESFIDTMAYYKSMVVKISV